MHRELSKAVEPFVKQEDEGKFRCKTCQKLFKATSFVEKHIANKHGELVKHLDDVRIVLYFPLSIRFSCSIVRSLISTTSLSIRTISNHFHIHLPQLAIIKRHLPRPMASQGP